MSPAEFVTRAVRLLADFVRSLDAPAAGDRTRTRRGTVLSASPTLASSAAPTATLAARWEQAGDLLAAGVLEALRAIEVAMGPAMPVDAGPLTAALSSIEGWREQLRRSVVDRPGRLRAFELVDLVVTCLRGVVTDGLLVDPRGFRAIDGEEFRDWLTRHGAAPETFESPLVTGVYDLAFAYHRGDPDQPMFSAGTGLYMSALMYFGYRGSIFWKMQAGMGDIVFAPLYQALVARGVRFEFFSRVDELRPDESGERLASVEIGRQRGPDDRSADPLVRVKGLPCFPAASDVEELELERTNGRRDDVDTTVLVVGQDVDDVVFALPIGVVDEVCAPLVASDRRWRDMARHIGTVATQAAQLWLREDDAALGLGSPGVTLTGHVKPFDTMSSMTHLLPAEDWPDAESPRSLWYLCSTMRTEDEEAGVDGVRDALVRHLDRHLADAAPGVSDDDGFRWDLLVGDGDGTRAGTDRQPVRRRQHRPVGAVHAVAAGHRPPPDPTGRERVRRPGHRRRLDGLRPERGLHRSRRCVGAPGRQRGARARTLGRHLRVVGAPRPAMSHVEPGGTPDPAALLEDVQRLGEVAAARVAEQFTRLVRLGATATGAGDSADGHDGRLVDGIDGIDVGDTLREARARAERAIDTAMGALGEAIHGYAVAVESAVRRGAPAADPASDAVVTVEVRDGHGSGSVWVHQDADEPSEALTVLLGPLVRADGEVLAASTCVDPSTVGPLAPDARQEVRVQVLLDGVDAPGRYHGVVLASPGDLAVRIVVDVVADQDDGS